MTQGRRKKNEPDSFRDRHYRCVESSGLISSIVKVVETDLHILAPRPVADEALAHVLAARRLIEDYIRSHPLFLSSLTPLPPDPLAPPIIQDMLEATRLCGVGPMAAVAGTVAEVVGRKLLAAGLGEVIVENGGDIFLARTRESTVAIFAGPSPLSGKLGLRVTPAQMPGGICCSSATVGHSLSFGCADAVVVLARSTPLADAAATRIGNEVQPDKDGVNKALAVAKTIGGLAGVLIIKDQQLGAWGEVELVPLG